MVFKAALNTVKNQYGVRLQSILNTVEAEKCTFFAPHPQPISASGECILR